jgi:hypothetical protein
MAGFLACSRSKTVFQERCTLISSHRPNHHSSVDTYACDGMNLHPLGMKSILHVDTNHANVRAQGRKVDLVLVVGASLRSICLSYRILADDFEYQVSALVAVVSRIQKTLVCGVDFKPAVGVPICFVTDTVGLSAMGCVHDGACYRDTLLINDKTLRVIHVTPQAVVALAAWRRLDRRVGE